jgi:hypothetical protein
MRNALTPLKIFVAWHSNFEHGIKYAHNFFSLFNRDVKNPLSRGIGIPVYFRNGVNPLEIDITGSENIAVILLVDTNMVTSDEWEAYVNKLIEQSESEEGSIIIYPVAITNNAFNLSNKLQQKNFIRLYEVDEYIKTDFLIGHIAHELCRLLYGKERISQDYSPLQSPPPLKLFISHAKEDGVVIAKSLSDYIQSKTELKTFFDANDIAIGYDFSQEIEAHIQNSVLLVIHSDKYSSREWCRKEVLLAKEHNRPIVVFNLLKEGEDRSFPYMANLMNIRVNDGALEESVFIRILSAVLRETLRFKYQLLQINYIINSYGLNDNIGTVLSRPPELLTLLSLKKESSAYIVYPDPPLSDEELDILTRYIGEPKFITPSVLPLIDKSNKEIENFYDFLKGINIGISISESDDISRYGYEHVHLQNAIVEMARYLLASGSTLAYGGDVRYDPNFNFADILFQLTRTYNKEIKKVSDKILNYVSYPIYKVIDLETKAKLRDIVQFIEVAPPEEPTKDYKEIILCKSPEDNYIWARSLTTLREKMNSDINARIILGGKLKGYKGRYPGIVEEGYLALKDNLPTYIIGSFGGGARAIFEALKGNKPQELTEEYQIQDKNYLEFMNYFNSVADETSVEKINYSNLLDFFNKKGIKGLNNGLSDEENEILFYTDNLIEIISLILKGLKNISS